MATRGPSDSGGVGAEERLQQISCDLSAVNAGLRRARKRVAREDHVPAALWKTACVIALLALPDVRAAASFLVAKKPRLHRMMRGLEEELHHVYNGTSETARLQHEDSAEDET